MEDEEAYSLCRQMYGACFCESHKKAACEAMVEMAANGTTAESERQRIEDEIFDCDYAD